MTMPSGRTELITDTVVPDDKRTFLLNHISWGAVFAGIAGRSGHPVASQYARHRHWHGVVQRSGFRR